MAVLTRRTNRGRRSGAAGRLNAASRLQLARPVTDDSRGRLVPADNGPLGGWLPLEAASADDCFAVAIKPTALALDSDQPSSGPSAEIRDLLLALGITPVVLASANRAEASVRERSASRATAHAGRSTGAAKIDVRT